MKSVGFTEHNGPLVKFTFGLSFTVIVLLIESLHPNSLVTTNFTILSPLVLKSYIAASSVLTDPLSSKSQKLPNNPAAIVLLFSNSNTSLSQFPSAFSKSATGRSNWYTFCVIVATHPFKSASSVTSY